MEAGLLSKLPNKTLVMSNKNQFPFSFTCLASKLFLLWMTSRRSGPMFEFFCLPQRPLNRLVHKRSVPTRGLQRTQCIGGVVCGAVAQAERERLLRQSNCSLLPLLPILTQPACIKTPAVHCAGESPRFSLDSLCGTS